MHIVLDLDGTLILCPATIPHPRPFLRDFLDYCFKYFDSVSIWTAASRNWYDVAWQHVLQPAMPHDAHFSHVLTCGDCVVSQKPLEKLWARCDAMTKNNTLVVDDTPTTYLENGENAVPVASFTPCRALTGDNELLKLIYFLERVRDHHRHTGTVCNMDKQHWSVEKVPLVTTVVGSLPKPAYLDCPDWFKLGTSGYNPAAWTRYRRPPDFEALQLFAVKDALQLQHRIDIVTDGEMRRDNYIYHHCRHLEGVDFNKLKRKLSRDGACHHYAPTITGKVAAATPYLLNEWKIAQAFCMHKSVKMTLPGPMTIADTLHNAAYNCQRDLLMDLASALNAEIRSLVSEGCRHVQIDEPVMARHPDLAIDVGMEALRECFQGVTAVRWVHICCGYPDHADQKDYPKADPAAYVQLAAALDQCVDVVSIEDAHRHNDLAQLLPLFQKATVALGVIDVSSSRLETVDAVEKRVREALKFIPRERLILTPDCGLGLLPWELVRLKLHVLAEAAQRLNA